ncbi:hypothetical protein I3F58_25950 [Streptomyces sp. MUM 203J]|uniref:hypothetical protein n=1 Tax=Streptomyces sp. MUM 203J TaxID=2791990 RepID=UPI001F044430|nr:hypothetical protein [Streptomyces sp. MUM 203J]MCH0542936.1 hypothetical protein [Streptomyces sp. MUM 203J]
MGVAGVAAAATRLAHGQLRRRPPGSPGSWRRVNYAGRTVRAEAGAAAAGGAALGAAVAAALPVRERCAVALAAAAGAVCGRYDDLRGDHRRGFRAHLGALRNGQLTSGSVKLFGVGAAGLAAGALVKERPLDKVLAGVVVAGTAHLVNLVDVRPGRAVLAVLALGVPGLLRGAPVAAAPMGAAAAVLADDVAERAMLGDMGAHALGGALGVAVAVANGRLGLVVHAAGLVAAAVGGEAVSRIARSPMWVIPVGGLAPRGSGK